MGYFRLPAEVSTQKGNTGKRKRQKGKQLQKDDVIKRKLLIEGDGGNDDRRISSLLKTFVKWCSSNESDEESTGTYQRMLSTLAQCEFAISKSQHVFEMNLREQKNYEKLNREIEENIQNALEKITKCKAELHQAKCIRRNKQEYDALAKVIQQHPDRQQTMKQLEALDEELERMKDKKQALMQKLELRKKQFHVLITAIHEMQRIVEDDDDTVEEDLEMDTL